MRTCEVEGCEREVSAKGLCHTHLTRQRRGAELTTPIQKYTYRHSRVCSVVGCNRLYHAKGLCRWHYLRHWHNKPLIQEGDIQLPAWARFASGKEKCDCGKVAVAVCGAGVGSPNIAKTNNRQAPIKIVMCLECLQYERYNRREITYRELKALLQEAA